MAIAKVADRGSASNVTSQSSTGVTLAAGASITVGNYLLLRIAADNSGTNGAASAITITDPAGNTWALGGEALQDPGAANAGTDCLIGYVKVVNGYSNGQSLTINYNPNVTAKAIVVEEWSGIDGTTPVAVAATTAVGTTGSPTISRTPTASGQLFYGAIGTEGPQSDTYTEDTDTTNGSWVSLTRLGTSDATAANNQTIAGAYKIVTGTSAQTWNPTITARDRGAVAMVFAAGSGVTEKSSSDSADATDATSPSYSASSDDSASATDASSPSVQESSADTCDIIDAFSVTIISNDEADASDSFTLSSSIGSSETVEAIDECIVTKISSDSITVSDAPGGIAMVSSSDSISASDASIAFVELTSSDSVSAIDVLGGIALLSSPDSASISDDLTLSAILDSADSALAEDDSEKIDLSVISKESEDSVSAEDAFQVDIVVLSGDTLGPSDAYSLMANTTTADDADSSDSFTASAILDSLEQVSASDALGNLADLSSQDFLDILDSAALLGSLVSADLGSLLDLFALETFTPPQHPPYQVSGLGIMPGKAPPEVIRSGRVGTGQIGASNRALSGGLGGNSTAGGGSFGGKVPEAQEG